MNRPGFIALPLSALGLLLAATRLLGQVGVAVPNWTVPPFTTSSAGEIRTMTDITSPRTFVGIQPCRVADTRGNNAPITGGIFANSEARNWTVAGICGIPVSSFASAISVNFTVVAAGGIPPGSFLLAWPTGSPPAQTTAIMTYGPGEVLSNAAIVPLNSSGQMTVNVSGSTHIIMDVNGYFSDGPGTLADFLRLVNNNPGGPTAAFVNTATAGRSSGVLGTQGPAIPTPANAGAGVRGEGPVIGVYGLSQGNGVAGSQVNSSGIERAFGILGWRSTMSYPPEILNSDVGVLGESFGSNGSGVVGYATATSGLAFGVQGVTLSPSRGAAGVRGIDGTGTAACDICSLSTGVRGESFGGEGVLGISNGFGVTGVHIDFSGSARTVAILGYSSTVGLYANGDLSVTGSKSFIEPHPTDASKIIRYFSLEGNESGTYFRGRGKFQNGLARIPVPEDFRIVTDPEGLTVQVTPIGAMATVAVMKMDLQEIVVQSSRDVEFSYTVNGIRQAYKDAGPIAENEGYFAPMSPDAPMMGSFPPVIRQRLISNGTYNADGTVNMETARRLGWDKVWEQRSPPAAQPAQP